MSNRQGSRKAYLKMVILGESGVGKTSLMNQFVSKKFSKQYKATIGADFTSKKELEINNRLVNLQIWDTAGQERFNKSALGVAFYRGTDACFLCYDITAEKSFDELDRWRRDFLQHANIKDPDSFPFVVLGNKVDREEDRKVPKSKALAWCKSKGAKPIPHFETSAKDAVNVEAAFYEAAAVALEREETETEVYMPDTIRLSRPAQAPKPAGCC
jgi:Ras-related protein Rab-7A